ncbi:MAG: hypothetical protein AB7H93_25075 [Vicinamibacterales bacterium]
MTRATTLTTAVLAAAIAWAGPAVAQERQEARSVALDAGGVLRLDARKGSVTITGWDRSAVDFKARIVAPSHVDAEYAARALAATAIDVVAQGGEVSIRSNYDAVPSRGTAWSDRALPAVHYEIRAPRAIRLHVDADRGPVTVAGFEGAVDLKVDRGALDLRDVRGDLTVTIDRGDRSRLADVAGRLRLEADRTSLVVTADQVGDRSRIDIQRGDLELRLPAGQGLTLQTDVSRRSRVVADVPVQWNGDVPRRATGHVNGGGPTLAIESDRGRVHIGPR